jgi:hypothetical protein
VADELRRQADQFIDLVDLQPYIEREPAYRPDDPSRMAVAGDVDEEDGDQLGG